MGDSESATNKEFEEHFLSFLSSIHEIDEKQRVTLPSTSSKFFVHRVFTRLPDTQLEDVNYGDSVSLALLHLRG